MPSSDNLVGIIGAGGIGSFYAMRLAQAGVRTIVVARGHRLDQLRADGLRVVHGSRRHEVQPHDILDWQTLAQHYSPHQFTALLLCTKAAATPTLGDAAARWFADWDEHCPLVSLQNGVDNEASLAEVLPPRCVVGGLAVRIGAHILDDGWVDARGPGELIIGPWPHSRDARPQPLMATLAEVLELAGVPLKISDDIQRELWRKLVINNGVNPLSALTGLDTRSLSREPPFAEIVYGLMAEAATAAQADHVVLTRQDTDEMYELIRGFDAIKTSMLVDREQGRALELDAICGAILSRHRQLGLDAPYTRLVNALLSHLTPP